MFLSVSMVGCNDAKETKDQKSQQAQKNACVELDKNFIPERVYSFRYEETIENNLENTNVKELTIRINGSSVEGNYNLLSGYKKDHRIGVFVGTIKENVITARYSFQQEGTIETEDIKIIISKGKTVVKAENPELGLNATFGDK